MMCSFVGKSPLPLVSLLFGVKLTNNRELAEYRSHWLLSLSVESISFTSAYL